MKEEKPHCPYCKSENIYGMSRVVGYFSRIENWNKSKKAELKKRQEGTYWDDTLDIESTSKLLKEKIGEQIE